MNPSQEYLHQVNEKFNVELTGYSPFMGNKNKMPSATILQVAERELGSGLVERVYADKQNRLVNVRLEQRGE